jgi:hypothetical protein
VFVAAESRGLGDLMAAFFEKVDPEARDLYSEWRQILPAEVLKRHRESVERIIPPVDPGKLIPPVRAAT